jgi:hypothetical protein
LIALVDRSALGATLSIQLFVPPLFHHSLIKLYAEVLLTDSDQYGEMGRKNNQTPKCINGVKKQQ